MFLSTRDGDSPLSKVHTLSSSATHSASARSPSALPQSLSQSSPNPRRHRRSDGSGESGKARRMTVREAAFRKQQAVAARRRLTEEKHERQRKEMQQRDTQRRQKRAQQQQHGYQEGKIAEHRQRATTASADSRNKTNKRARRRARSRVAKAQADTPDAYGAFSGSDSSPGFSSATPPNQQQHLSSSGAAAATEAKRQQKTRKDEVWKMLVSPDPMAAATAVAVSTTGASSTSKGSSDRRRHGSGGRILQRARQAMSSIESKLQDACSSDEKKKQTREGASQGDSVDDDGTDDDNAWKDAREPPPTTTSASSRTASAITKEVFHQQQAEDKPNRDAERTVNEEKSREHGADERKRAEPAERAEDTQPVMQGPRERIRARRNRRGPATAVTGPPEKIKSEDGVDPRPPAGPPPRSGRWKAVPGRFRMPEKELLSSPSELSRGVRRPSRSRKRSPIAVQAMLIDASAEKSKGLSEQEEGKKNNDAAAETKVSSSSPFPSSRFGRRDIAAEVKRDLREEAKISQESDQNKNAEDKRAEELAMKKDMKRRARAQMIERSPLMPITNTLNNASETKKKSKIRARNKRKTLAGNPRSIRAETRRPALPSSSFSSSDGSSRESRRAEDVQPSTCCSKNDVVISEASFPLPNENDENHLDSNGDEENDENNGSNSNTNQRQRVTQRVGDRLSRSLHEKKSPPMARSKRRGRPRRLKRNNRLSISEGGDVATSRATPSSASPSFSPATPSPTGNSSDAIRTPKSPKNASDATTPHLPDRSPFYSHLRCCQGLSELKSRITTISTGPASVVVASPSSTSPMQPAHMPSGFSLGASGPELEERTCTVILVAGKVRPVPTVAVQFRDSRLPAGMLRLVEVELPVVPKPVHVSIKRFVQERTEELVARLRLEAPGFANAPAHKLRKVLGSLLVATVTEEEVGGGREGKHAETDESPKR